MTIIDRPLARHRATKASSSRESGVNTALGGRYISTTSDQPDVEGSYVSTGSLAASTYRGTYVSAFSQPVRHGGSYTYTG